MPERSRTERAAPAGVVVEARDLSVYDAIFGNTPITGPSAYGPIADGEVA